MEEKLIDILWDVKEGKKHPNRAYKELCVLFNVIVPKGTLCQHDRSVTNRICDDCGSTITYVPDKDLA